MSFSWRSVTAGLVVCVFAFALPTASPLRAQPRAPLEPYVIPALLSLTGGLAFLGQQEQLTLQILEKSTNESGGIKGRPVHFDIQDDQSSPQVAVQLTNALIAKHAPVVMGSDFLQNCAAMAPLLKDGPVAYCFSPAMQPPGGSYMFSSGVGAADIVTAAVRYFHRMGLHRFGAIWATDASGQDAERHFNAVLALPEFKDIQVVSSDHFNATEISVVAQIAHLRSSNAEVCFCWGSGNSFATILRGYTEAGLHIPVMTSPANMTFAQMNQYAAAALDNKSLYFVGYRYFGRSDLGKGPLRDVVDAFYRAFSQSGNMPDSGAGSSWDPGRIVIAAIRDLGPNATAEQIRDYIAHLHDFVGIDGVYDFTDGSQRGLTDQSVIMTRWSPSQQTWVEQAAPKSARK